MNIRLDSEKIRIRISREEALQIASGVDVCERLRFLPHQDLVVRLKIAEEAGLNGGPSGTEWVLCFPRRDLMSWMDATRKEDLVRSYPVTSELRIDFEIDAWSGKKGRS